MQMPEMLTNAVYSRGRHISLTPSVAHGPITCGIAFRRALSSAECIVLDIIVSALLLHFGIGMAGYKTYLEDLKAPIQIWRAEKEKE